MSEQAAATSQPITSNSNARPGELEVRPTVRPNAMTSQSDDQSGNDQQIDQRTVNENIVKTLNALNEKASSETGVAKLIADPIIRSYLEQKNTGRQVSIVDQTELATLRQQVAQLQAQPKPVEVPPDIENLDNKGLVKFLLDSNQKMMAQMLDSNSRKVSQDVQANIAQQIGPALQYLQQRDLQSQNQEVDRQITEVKKEFADFEQVRPLMAQISKTSQGLSARELYLIAKARAGTPMLSQNRVGTERGDSAPGDRGAGQVSANRRELSTQEKLGKGGFGALLDRALSGNLAGIE